MILDTIPHFCNIANKDVAFPHVQQVSYYVVLMCSTKISFLHV